MIDERGHDTATLYDQQGKIVGAILSTGEQLVPTPTGYDRYVRAWSDRTNSFIFIGPVRWDGAAPDLHGGFSHGELMPPTIDPPPSQFRLRSQLPSLIQRLTQRVKTKSTPE